MVLAVPTAISHSGAPFPRGHFTLFRETKHLLKNVYFMVMNIEILKNILKIKYISINFLSSDHIIFP